MSGMLRICRKFWRGQYPLLFSFWGFYIGGWIVVSFVSGIIAVVPLVLGLRPLAVLVFALALIGYPVWAAVGVWRSAMLTLTRAGGQIWQKLGFC